MGHDFFSDDEDLEDVGTAYEERDPDVNEGKKIARERQYRALVGDALDAKPLDDNDVTDEPEKHEHRTNAESIIEAALPNASVARAKIIATVEQELPKKVVDKVAKKQRTASYDDAMNEWNGRLKDDPEFRVASGFRPKGKKKDDADEELSTRAEPLYIKEAIERENIKGDKSRLLDTLERFCQDFSGTVYAFGDVIQRDSNGKLIFQGTMTYDLKKREVSRKGANGKPNGDSEMGSENRVRVMTKNSVERIETWHGKGYDKVVKTVVTDAGTVDNAGYNPARGDLLPAERISDTKQRAEEVAVAVGPLMIHLWHSAFENASARDVGECFGLKMPQASAVGNAILQMALEAAGAAYDRIRERESSGINYREWIAKQSDGLAIPARRVKQAYDTRAKIKAEIIAEVDQAMAANDNRRVALNNAA